MDEFVDYRKAQGLNYPVAIFFLRSSLFFPPPLVKTTIIIKLQEKQS